MKNSSKNIFILLMVSMLLAGITGCEKKGPMERAGEKIDNAGEKTGEAIKKTGEKIKDPAH